MKESDIQTKFNQWLKRNWYNGTAAFELKIVKAPDKSLPYSAIRDNQYKGLRLAKKRLIWKLSDEDRREKPFDSFIIQEGQAYVAICWFTPRKQKSITLIDVEDLMRYRANSSKKSINQHEANSLATFILEL